MDGLELPGARAGPTNDSHPRDVTAREPNERGHMTKRGRKLRRALAHPNEMNRPLGQCRAHRASSGFGGVQ